MNLTTIKAQSLHFIDELFFTPTECIQENEKLARLEGQEAVHCISVLRYKVGQKLMLTNGEGVVYETRLISAKKSSVQLELVQKYVVSPSFFEFPILVIGSLKNKERLEWVIEKATEIGVQHIYIVQTSRSERFSVKTDRLQAIALAAMKQSKQVYFPQIHSYSSLKQLVFSEDTVHIIAHEKSKSESIFPHDIIEKTIFLKQNKPIVYWIGPEGGFTDEEISFVTKQYHSHLLFLGEHRLRAETAALYVIQIDAVRRLKIIF